MTLAAQSPDAIDDFFQSSTWDVIRNLGLLLAVVFWLAMAYWVYKDARRRVDDPWLVAMAVLVGLIPIAGPIVYMFFRPPEYLEDVRERDLEIKAMEERLAAQDLRCPVCRAQVESSYLVCPVCTSRLKHACGKCGSPLEAIWQACPHCATPVPPAAILGAVDEPKPKPARKRSTTSTRTRRSATGGS